MFKCGWRAQPDWKAWLTISGIVLVVGCSRFDRANAARAEEIRKLSRETFAQAAGHDHCPYISCARQEAGFAYAKGNHVENPDGCLRKGDDDFVEGCRQYGEDVEEAYARIANGS